MYNYIIRQFKAANVVDLDMRKSHFNGPWSGGLLVDHNNFACSTYTHSYYGNIMNGEFI